MTGTLPQRVKALRARLSRLDEMGANAAETGLLDDLRVCPRSFGLLAKFSDHQPD
jgi:hypothetical protein